MQLTIIIPTLERARSLEQFFCSMQKQKRLPNQIIIVDASNGNETEELVKNLPVPLLGLTEYFKTERGLTKQRNFGITKSTGDVIGFFDDDVVLTEQYLAKIIEIFETDCEHKIGGATGFIINQTLTAKRNFLKHFVSDFWMDFWPKCCKVDLMPIEPFFGCVPLRHVSGCNMFFRKEVFKEFTFDTWFDGYGLGEDLDFGLRVSKKWLILGSGDARLEHLCDPAGRPNYYKLGKMLFENHARILTVARTDNLRLWATLLIFRYLGGILLKSFTLIFNGRAADGISYCKGAMDGIKAGFNHIAVAQKSAQNSTVDTI